VTDNKRTIRKVEPSTVFWSQLLVSWEAEVISMRLPHHLQSSYLLTPSDDDTPVSWQNNTANFLNDEGLIGIGLVHITHWHVWAAPHWSKQNSNTPLVYFCTIFFFFTFNKQKKMLEGQSSSYLWCMLQILDYTDNQLGNAHSLLVQLVPCLWQIIKY